MCEAGRVRHHLKHNLWNPKSSVIFVGYQARGSLGRMLLEGAGKVNLFGEEIQVSAEIHNLEGFSAHADRNGLLEWLSRFQKKPKEIFLVHGEKEAKESFARLANIQLGYDPVVISGNSEFVLEKDEIADRKQILQEVVGEEELGQIQDNIGEVLRRLEDILYHARLAVNQELSPEEIEVIKKGVLQLEKDSLSLGSIIARNRENL
jgi:metallo-beta-lactamase family protein